VTSPLPPKRRDSRNLADLLRQDRTRLGQLDRGLAGGRAPMLRPLKQPFDDGGEDDFDVPAILFANTDHGTCASNGATIQIPLTHVPEEGSEQVYYNGLPLKWSDWTRTDTVLTIPGEPWFRAGKVAWVDYAYEDDDGAGESDPAAFVAVTTIQGDHTSIALPGTSNIGDMLVLVLHARDVGTCSDSRFTRKQWDGTGKWGIWVGTDDGSGNPVAITLSSPSGGGLDGCGALARITGTPLLPVTSEQTDGLSGSTTFAPTMPTGGTFAVIAMVSGTTLTSGFINDDSLGHWTTRASTKGNGSGLAQVLIATSNTGPTSGQWSNTGGSSAGWGSWAGGLQ
jgi:hypothetical protein